MKKLIKKVMTFVLAFVLVLGPVVSAEETLLTEKQYTELKEKVAKGGVLTIDEYNAILAYEKHQEENSQFGKAKKALKEKVKNTKYLTEAQKKDFNAEIENADSLYDLEEVLSKKIDKAIEKFKKEGNPDLKPKKDELFAKVYESDLNKTATLKGEELKAKEALMNYFTSSIKNAETKEALELVEKELKNYLEKGIKPVKPVFVEGYISTAVKLRDVDGKYLGIDVPRNTKVKGEVVKNAKFAVDRVKITYKDKEGFVYVSYVVEKPVEITGYARAAQNIRNEKGEKVGVLPRGHKVVGVPANGLVGVEYKGVKGTILEANLLKKPLVTKGVAKFTQRVRNHAGEYLFLDLPKGTLVEGQVDGYRLKINFNGIEGYVFLSNLKIVK